MIDWIKDTIDPPGIDKKNRSSIFKTIGKIMGIVLSDAKKAYNAHFPYLADEKKLEQHGSALYIPQLMYDKPEEFRYRVAAASFFLMRAGSRGFIMDMLKNRLDDRFQVIEKFLQIHARIVDLTDAEKKWVFGLLDTLIDPNVSLELSEWLRFTEEVLLRDSDIADYIIRRTDIDTFGKTKLRDGTHKRNGSINRERTGFRDEFKIRITYKKYFRDGTYKRDGSIPHRMGGMQI